MPVQVDDLFARTMAERLRAGMKPDVAERYLLAWRLYRDLPGSENPQEHNRLHLRLPYVPSRLIRGLLAAWQAQGELPRFHLSPLPPPRPEGESSRPMLLDRDVRALTAHITDLGVRVLTYLVYVTGIKPQRLMALEVTDIGIQEQVLSLSDEVKVMVRPEAVEALRLWLGQRHPGATSLLHDQSGQPLTLTYAAQTLRSAGAQAGYPALGFGHLQRAYLRLHYKCFLWLDAKDLHQQTQQSFHLKYLLPSPELWAAPEFGSPLIFPPEALFPRSKRRK